MIPLGKPPRPRRSSVLWWAAMFVMIPLMLWGTGGGAWPVWVGFVVVLPATLVCVVKACGTI